MHMQPDPIKETLKAHLLKLGYPWPGNLENKSLWWLSTEIRAIQPAKNGRPMTEKHPKRLGD